MLAVVVAALLGVLLHLQLLPVQGLGLLLILEHLLVHGLLIGGGLLLAGLAARAVHGPVWHRGVQSEPASRVGTSV